MGIFSELFQCFLPIHDAFLFMWGLALLGAVAFSIALERVIDINRRTDYDAPTLFENLKTLLLEKKFDEAFSICCSGGRRALPRVLGAGINKMSIEPALVVGAMTEESVHMASRLEKRLNLLVMFGNTSTLLGLLGTVFGLIMSFAAVGKPGVAAVEKSALLANGISAAMNSTLVGLSISIPCVLIYAWLRARVEIALQEIDRYAIAILKILNPPSVKEKPLSTIGRKREEEEPADTDVTPMLNLMVLLIPFLLTQSEFVKIGAIEMKLPESSQGAGGGGGADQQQVAKLDLGIVITSKGFNIFSYFKTDSTAASRSTDTASQVPDIPMKNNDYDFAELNMRLTVIKKKALIEILKPFKPSVSESSPMADLYSDFTKLPQGSVTNFADNDAVKIVAEEKIKYKTVVAVMDAARGARTDQGNVTLFPNVSIAGGIIQ
jgi:biopolymer transport protein ExbB/TolQ/biopolymer transport protein ExbD